MLRKRLEFFFDRKKSKSYTVKQANQKFVKAV